MRWSCCSLLLLALAACTQRVSRHWVPSPNNPRWSAERATEVLEGYLRVQCPALREARKPDTGETMVTVAVDTAGLVTRAELEGSTGDETVDGLFGTIAAQLQLERGTPPERKLRMGYSCAASGAAVATIHPAP